MNGNIYKLSAEENKKKYNALSISEIEKLIKRREIVSVIIKAGKIVGVEL